MSTRPSFDDTFLSVAKVLSLRATCPKRQVGCVITDDKNRILGVGYNGAPRGMAHCTEVGCREIDGHCTRAIHAEFNAIINSPFDISHGTLYLVGAGPCYRCVHAVLGTGITRVVIGWFDKIDFVALDLLREGGVDIDYYYNKELL